MRRLPLLALTSLTLGLLASINCGLAQAQTKPFDMTPERGGVSNGQTPALQQSPGQQAPPGTATRPGQSARLVALGQGDGELRRYLLNAPSVKLQGEVAAQTMAIYLTPEQAASEATLSLGYSNALVVAPEASHLTVTINDASVLDVPIRGGETPQQAVVAVPRGALIPGINRIRLASEQRHRTDCTAESTYELWTDIDAAKTYLSFATPNAGTMKRLDDIKAIGVDEKGRSRFTIVAPDLDKPAAAPALLQLAQSLSLLSGSANGSFAFTKTLPTQRAPGEVIVLAATTAQMSGLIGATEGANPLPVEASGGKTTSVAGGTMAGFVSLPGLPGQTVLAFSGPDWRDIRAIADNFARFAADGDPRRLKTAVWRGLDTPLLDKAGTWSFASLGIADQEFSGRRFTTDFTVGMPADFYANNYGTATILLDAAYSSKVLPGSQIVVTVNGHLATTVPITATGGAVLRRYPIRVTLRNFHPGVNVIGLEAVMKTQADAACAPGETADKTPRFALFGSSQFVMPEIAHLSQAPDLAATAALGFPLASADQPTSLVLGKNDDVTLAAAATVVGKLASAARHVLPLDIIQPSQRPPGRNALFIGAAPDLPSPALANVQMKATGGNEEDLSTEVKLNSWRDKVDSSTVMALFSGINAWMKETFDLNLASVNLWPGTETPFQLPSASSGFLSQTITEDGAILTTFSAPDLGLLKAATIDMADLRNWNAISGRASAYDARHQEIVASPAQVVELRSIQPWTLTNLRLVAANWLSGNFIIYAGGLVVSAIMLGIATHGLMDRMGRGHGGPKD